MELSHESHEHSLYFVDGESDTDELLCWGCDDFICGARYSCSTCDFHLHESCTELPPRFKDHPFHPQHPLSLLSIHPNEGGYICGACGKDIEEEKFVYHCSICDFDLHAMCALSVDLKVSIILGGNGEKELFRYGAYNHLLMLEEEQSISLDMNLKICFVCKESMSAPFFFCSKSRCDFHLHKSCAELPQRIRINFFHPQHPLFLLSYDSNECQFCGQNLRSQHAYVCIPCDFRIHPRCAFSNSTDVIKRMRIKLHPDLQGELEPWREPKFRADEQPQQIENNYFHPEHPLCLDSECSGECKICGQENDPPTYACKPCHFFCHLRCALLNPNRIIKREGEIQIQHSSHDHSLIFVEKAWPWLVKRIQHCHLCRKEVDSFPGYCCRLCKFFLHKSCAELPPQIKSHLHPDHFLFSLPKPPPGKLYCDCCAETVLGLNYYCIQCGFILDVDCFLSRRGFEQLYDHKHCFIDLKTYTKLSCQFCGDEGYFSPSQCSSCHILVHKKCANLPSILKLVSHHHYFKLTYSLSLVHKCDEMICKLCYRKVKVDSSAYYCSEYNYAAHIECAPKVKQLVSEEENEDGHHASKESQNSTTNSDISSSQDEDIKSGVIQHFSHQHELMLIEQDLEDHKYCEKQLVSEEENEDGYHTSKESQNSTTNSDISSSQEEDIKSGVIQHFSHQHELTLIEQDLEDHKYCEKQLVSEEENEDGHHASKESQNSTTNSDISSSQEEDIKSGVIQHFSHQHELTLIEQDLEDHKYCEKQLVSEEENEDGYHTSKESQNSTTNSDISSSQEEDIKSGVIQHFSHQHELTLIKQDLEDHKYCEKQLVSEEENEDGHHASKESQNSTTNSDISSSQEEDIKSGVIQHFSHQHELTLIEQDLEDHKYCEGCVTLIFPPFYSCKQCNFYLHKRCGKSPRTTTHPLHDHSLTLNVVEDLIWCNECGYCCNGFMYSCQARKCTYNLDLQCADTLSSEGIQHPCHEHPLFFPYTREYENCKGCGRMQEHILVCSKCNYVLGYCCLRIPHVAKHRYDNHLLKLTCINDDESDEYYCDICEEERDPKFWFYHCSQCEFSAHIGCTIGQFSHLKCGVIVNDYSHDHPLTLVEKCQRKNPPLCSSCGKRCHSRVLECCQCNLHFHFSLSCLRSY